MYRQDELYIIWYRPSGSGYFNPTLYDSEEEMREVEAKLNPDEGQVYTQTFQEYVAQNERTEAALQNVLRAFISDSAYFTVFLSVAALSWFWSNDWGDALKIGATAACLCAMYLLHKWNRRVIVGLAKTAAET